MSSAIRSLGSSIISGLRMASPFLLDQLVYQVFADSQELKTRTAYKAASLVGFLAIWKVCPASRQKLVGGLYVAYKVVHYFYVRSSASSQSPQKEETESIAAARTNRITDVGQTPPATLQLPDPKERFQSFLDFRSQFIIRCSNEVPENIFTRKDGGGFLLQGDSFATTVYQLPDMQSAIDIKKGLWKEPQVQRQFGELLQLFAQDMDIVYQRLEEEAVYAFKQSNLEKEPSDKEKYQAMARFLETSGGDCSYDLIRWCDGKNMSLPRMYWMARNRLVLITLENGSNKRALENKITNENPDPFVTPGTPEYGWKETYNRVIQKFTPILEKLQPSDDIRKYMVLDDLEETY